MLMFYSAMHVLFLSFKYKVPVAGNKIIHNRSEKDKKTVKSLTTNSSRNKKWLKVPSNQFN